MKITLLIILLFFKVIANSQGVVGYLKENSFSIKESNEKYSDQVSFNSDFRTLFGGGGSHRETDLNNVTSLQINACLEGDVFAFYESLYKYNTPLKQKLFKEDYPTTYAEYQAKLSDAKLFYLNGYQYAELRFDQQSNYNLENNTFNLYQKLYGGSKQLDLVKKQIASGNLVANNGDVSPFVFSRLDDVEQVLVPDRGYGFSVNTIVKVENERDALKIENNGNLRMIVFYNQVSKKNILIKPLKVLFHINGEIIKNIGVNSKIDGLIEGYVKKVKEKKPSKEAKIDLGYLFENGDNDGLDVFGIGHGGGGEIGDGSTRIIKQEPNLDNLIQVPAKVAVKIKIDRQGEVFWSEAQIHHAYTNNADETTLRLAEKKAQEFRYMPTTSSAKYDVKIIKFNFKVK
ncbi:MAG: hypothetical protein P8L20_03030 [Flavobacteriales bacterium]|nr:hypothetical protein [Flavobacteriales bacterium]